MATGLENLKVYKLAVRLEVFVHKVVKLFPKDERFRSVDQLKRSASSIVNNIAESYGRFTYKSKINHLYIARGEAEETRSGVKRAYKKEFASKKIVDFTYEKYTELIKGLNEYIKFLKKEHNKK